MVYTSSGVEGVRGPAGRKCSPVGCAAPSPIRADLGGLRVVGLVGAVLLVPTEPRPLVCLSELVAFPFEVLL